MVDKKVRLFPSGKKKKQRRYCQQHVNVLVSFWFVQVLSNNSNLITIMNFSNSFHYRVKKDPWEKGEMMVTKVKKEPRVKWVHKVHRGQRVPR